MYRNKPKGGKDSMPAINLYERLISTLETRQQSNVAPQQTMESGVQTVEEIESLGKQQRQELREKTV